MIILDTDHLTVLKYARDARFVKLAGRMADSVDQDFVTTAITLEEQLRGWLAEINRSSDPEKQIAAYSELTGLIEFFSLWTILPFDDAAASTFRQFRSRKIRAGSMDLKIASIAVSLNCILLTSNTRDFASIPELRTENWFEYSWEQFLPERAPSRQLTVFHTYSSGGNSLQPSHLQISVGDRE